MMMMIVIVVTKYFSLTLAHQHVHLILLQNVWGKQKTGSDAETVAAAAATLSKHRRMHVAFMSLPKLKLPTASLISPPLFTNHWQERELFCKSFVWTSSLLMGK